MSTLFVTTCVVLPHPMPSATCPLQLRFVSHPNMLSVDDRLLQEAKRIEEERNARRAKAAEEKKLKDEEKSRFGDDKVPSNPH